MGVQFASLSVIKIYIYNFRVSLSNPSIAQLVERRTVEELKLSLGRWFESGSKEYFFSLFSNFQPYFAYLSGRDR